MLNILGVVLVSAVLANTNFDARARATLETGAARMGGIAALRSVERVRIESMTEWQRTTLDGRPHAAVLSYEWSTELRDYANPAWRYTRRFLGTTGWMEIVDLVVDSVAAIKNSGRWGPLNVAYVDERSEVFTFAPERLMVLAYDDANATSLADTTLGGVQYARVRATVQGFDATLYFGKGDGFLAKAQFRAAQPRDFGLAGWGAMDVTIAYSRWQRMREVAVNLPMQFDILRVAKPYKRVTVLSATINPAFAADSMTMPDSLRRAFLALGNRPMYDVPFDSARIVNSNVAVFGAPGSPAGAIKVGGRWLLIEAGAAPLSAERSVAFLAKADASTAIAGAILSQPSAQAGMIWLADHKIKTWVTAGAKPYVAATIRGWKPGAPLLDARNATWLQIGTDSVRIENIDLPDFPATAVVYVPALRWVYAAPAFSPMLVERIGELVKQRGWVVERIASARNISGVPMPN
jgi:hypothetical protein